MGDSNRCAPALSINPSPKVYKACQDGSKKAFDMACVQMCATETATSFERKSSKACKTSRSSAQHWCKRGFASVVKKLYTYDFPENEPEIIDNETLQENVVVVNEDEASPVVEDDVVDGPEETKAELEEMEVIESEPIAEMEEDNKVEVREAKDKAIEAEPELEPVTEMTVLEVNSIEPEPEESEAEHVHAFEKLEEEDDDKEEPEIDDNTNVGYSEF